MFVEVSKIIFKTNLFENDKTNLFENDRGVIVRYSGVPLKCSKIVMYVSKDSNKLYSKTDWA